MAGTGARLSDVMELLANAQRNEDVRQDVQRAESGIRAQALDLDGKLVDDFRITHDVTDWNDGRERPGESETVHHAPARPARPWHGPRGNGDREPVPGNARRRRGDLFLLIGMAQRLGPGSLLARA